MAGFARFLGSRKPERGAGAPSGGPTARGKPVPGGPGAPTAAAPSDSPVRGLAPGAGTTDGQDPPGLVIHARRVDDVGPAPRPSSAA